MVSDDIYHRVPLTQTARLNGLPMFEPTSLWNIPSGGRVSLKADVVVSQVNGYRCRTAVHGKGFVLDFAHDIPTRRIAIIHARVSHDHRGTVLTIEEDSDVPALQPIASDSIFRVKELCAGIAGLTTGGQFCGFHTTAAVEKQAPFCSLLESMGRTTVVQGDIMQLTTLSKIHAAAPSTDGLAMGFSCQPFSTGGERRGGEDARALTLAGGLWIAFMLDCPYVLLECVSQAPTDQYVKQCIHTFQQHTGYC